MKAEKQMLIISTILLIASLMGVLFFKESITGLAIKETFLQEETATALDKLLEAEVAITNLRNEGFTTNFFNDMLRDSKKYFFGNDFPALRNEFNQIQDPSRFEYSQKLLEDFTSIPSDERMPKNRSKSIEISNSILERKKQALEIRDKILLLEQKTSQSDKKEINVKESNQTLIEAMEAINEERYEEALQLLEESQGSLNKADSEYIKVLSLTQNFFERYWWQSITGLIVLIILGLFSFEKYKIFSTRSKLRNYKIELETLTDLMKKAQTDALSKGSLSISLYNIKMENYRGRVNIIESQMPILEAIIFKNKK